MRRLLRLLGLAVLGACAPTITYDIDVECGHYIEPQVMDEDSIYFVCDVPTFNILCDVKTLQRVGTGVFCTTHDGKSVRIIRPEEAQLTDEERAWLDAIWEEAMANSGSAMTSDTPSCNPFDEGSECYYLNEQ